MLLPSPSKIGWVSMVGVGFDPSSELRVKKNRKETTIIEVNTIYSPVLLNDWDLYMARPSPEEREDRTETNFKVYTISSNILYSKHALTSLRLERSLSPSPLPPQMTSTNHLVVSTCCTDQAITFWFRWLHPTQVIPWDRRGLVIAALLGLFFVIFIQKKNSSAETYLCRTWHQLSLRSC